MASAPHLIDLDEPLNEEGELLWFRAATDDGFVWRVGAASAVVASLVLKHGGAHRDQMCLAAGRALADDPDYFSVAPFVVLTGQDFA